MGGIRFQSMQITQVAGQPVIVRVTNDGNPSMMVNNTIVGEDVTVSHGTSSMQPMPRLSFSLLTALASIIAAHAAVLPHADELQRMVRLSISDCLDPKGATQRTAIVFNADKGHAQVTLPAYDRA